jgi:rhodanese-related sulfurtransferase
MPSVNSISVEKLARLIGTPNCPALIDVRVEADLAGDPRLIPGSVTRRHADPSSWVAEIAGQLAIVICAHGHALSAGVAAWLRQAGVQAEALDGGIAAWADAGLPLIPVAKLPPRDAAGRTVWVTRERPKIDRIACPRLIRRFVDPAAVFLFVQQADVAGVSERFAATPFDVEGVFWSHRGEKCSFDVMIDELGLSTEPLRRLAAIIRGADTARLDLAPEAPGLLAASLGLSRMYSDDLAQLEAGMVLYDAFYRWCRDATDETHNWPSAKKPGARP